MKYLVKNRKTGEEALCEKVVVDNHDYYLSENPELEDYCYNPRTKEFFKVLDMMMVDGLNKNKDDYKIIATTNKSLDLPMVIDEVEELARKEFPNNGTIESGYLAGGYKIGYQKAKETYQFTKEDLINFKQHAPKILQQLNGASDEGLFDIWQEQRTIKITVE